MLCFLTVKKRLERRSVIYCYHGSKMSRCQKSFWDGRKVRARNALAIRKGRDWANTIYFNFTQVVGSYANFLQQMKAFTREKSSISTGVFRLATESNRSRSRKRSRKSAYDLVKIKDECRKRSDNRNGIGLSEESERFHFFRHPLRLNRLRFACDLVKTRLPESEAETEVACSRLSDSGEDAKEKRTRKVGGAGKRKKERRERACNHFFYDPLPSTFGTFEMIRFRLSNCWNVNELESFSNFSRDYFTLFHYNPSCERVQSGV